MIRHPVLQNESFEDGKVCNEHLFFIAVALAGSLGCTRHSMRILWNKGVNK